MERLPHVFLVGEGAARFAREMETEAGELLTEPTREVWARRLEQDLAQELEEIAASLPDLWRWSRDRHQGPPAPAHGTVNVIARDAQGHICAGVSTAGGH